MLTVAAMAAALGCAPPSASGGRSFPANPDLATVVIDLERTACFGSCPIYHVSVTGDGKVEYEGQRFVLLTGKHEWRIPRDDVRKLVDLFRSADYFNLENSYEATITDLPTVITRLRIGARQKSVRDYGGGASADFMKDGKEMPEIVNKIEFAIDRISRASSVSEGDDLTISMLESAGWQFSSDEGGRALEYLIANCNLEVARSFIERGAPIPEKIEITGRSRGGPAIVAAAGCADADFVRLLEGKVPPSGDVARELLFASASDGYPEIVEIALRHAKPANATAEYDAPLIFNASSPNSPSREASAVASFDPGRVITLLVSAGADPRARFEGATPLHWATSDSTAMALLKAGADPNAADSDGSTPLFSAPGPETARELLKRGARADIRDSDGRTPLFDVSSPDIVRILVAAGVDPNAESKDGSTAFMSADSEAAALALLEAGARVSATRWELESRIEYARGQHWMKLIPILERAEAEAQR